MPEIRQRTVRQNVEQLLREYPETRGNDKVLLTYYWYMFDGVKFEGIKEFAETFKEATPEGTITRNRRYIQYDPDYTGERYLPDGNLTKMRRIRAERIKKEYGTK
jgi:hypothetical protein